MNKYLLSAAVAVAAFSFAPAAFAAQSISFSPPAADGSISGTFQNEGINAGSFSDSFSFSYPSAGLGGATISSIFSVNQNNNVDFTSVTLNGTALNIGVTGDVEFRFLNNLPVPAGLQSLLVTGTSGGNGSYAGTLSFGAVPEPATWGMLIIGFGGIGMAMRRRQKSLRVSLV